MKYLDTFVVYYNSNTTTIQSFDFIIPNINETYKSNDGNKYLILTNQVFKVDNATTITNLAVMKTNLFKSGNVFASFPVSTAVDAFVSDSKTMFMCNQTLSNQSVQFNIYPADGSASNKLFAGSISLTFELWIDS